MGTLQNEKFESQIIPRALHLLLGNVSASDEQKRALSNYIHERFKKIGTCILWPRNSELCDLLSNLGLSVDSTLGKKEIVIKRNYILFSPNLKTNIPKEVFIA